MRAILMTLVVVAGCAKRPATPAKQEAPQPRVGSVYVTKTVTTMRAPYEHEAVTTTKHTVVARTERDVSLTVSDDGGTYDVIVPLAPPVVSAHDGSTVTKVDEMCVVPAGTFECTRTSIELRQGDARRSSVTWTAKTIPVPIKSIVTNENMTIATELTSYRPASTGSVTNENMTDS